MKLDVVFAHDILVTKGRTTDALKDKGDLFEKVFHMCDAYNILCLFV